MKVGPIADARRVDVKVGPIADARRVDVKGLEPLTSRV